jgi:hypothetical protein
LRGSLLAMSYVSITSSIYLVLPLLYQPLNFDDQALHNREISNVAIVKHRQDPSFTSKAYI